MLTSVKLRTVVRRGGALLAAGLILTSCGWKGIANVPMPDGAGTGADTMTLYVQMPDTLALNVNSRVRVADVFVGSVRAIELKNWVATLTLDVQKDLKLPSNTLAKIGQTSLLGSQHVELDPPHGPVVCSAAEERGHHPAAELLVVPHHGAGAGEHRHHPDRWWHPEPRDHPDRDQQHPVGSRGSDPRVPRPVGHLHRRVERAARGHRPRHRFDEPVAVDRRAAQRHPGSRADRVPAVDQALRRYPRPVRRRGHRAGPDQQGSRRHAVAGEPGHPHQPAEPAAAAGPTGQGLALPGRCAEIAAHGSVQHRERAEGHQR